MKKIVYILSILFLASCTSNTILEPPKDLIPKDTMSILIQDMMIASSAKFVRNSNLQKEINYMALVYDKYKIDSIRFNNSNRYYISNIDEYIKIFQDAKQGLNDKKIVFEKIKRTKDSLRSDSIKKARELKTTKLDSIKVMPDL